MTIARNPQVEARRLRGVGLALCIAAASAACESKKPEPTAAAPSGPPSTVETSSAAEVEAAAAAPSPSGEVPAGSTAAIAYAFGRAYGFALSAVVVKKPQQVAAEMRKARAAAKALGVPEPPEPTDGYLEKVAKISQQIEKKHGARLQALFIVGGRLIDAFAASSLKNDVAPYLSDLEAFLPKTGLPESLWKDELATLKLMPGPEGFKRLSNSIMEHLAKAG